MIWLDFSNLYRIFMWFKVTVLYTFVFSIGFLTVHILKRAKKKCNVFIQDIFILFQIYTNRCSFKGCKQKEVSWNACSSKRNVWFFFQSVEARFVYKLFLVICIYMYLHFSQTSLNFLLIRKSFYLTVDKSSLWELSSKLLPKTSTWNRPWL